MVCSWMSFGMSTRTGPGRPPRAIAKARWIAGSMSPTDWTRIECFVTGPTIPSTSVSWNASRPMSGVDTWPVIATTGTLSM